MQGLTAWARLRQPLPKPIFTVRAPLMPLERKGKREIAPPIMSEKKRKGKRRDRERERSREKRREVKKQAKDQGKGNPKEQTTQKIE